MLHGIAYAIRRRNVLQLNAVYFHTPFVGRIIQDCAQFGVDGISGSQSLIQFQLANHVTECSLCEFFNRVGEIVDFVNRFYRIHNLKIQKGVDAGRYIIFGNDILLREIIDLLAQINHVRLFQYRDILAQTAGETLANAYFTGFVQNGPDDIDAGRERSVISSQTLDNFGFWLRDNFETE